MTNEFNWEKFYNLSDEQENEVVENLIDKNSNLTKIFNMIYSYAGIDGAHHKDWLLDQIMRSITGDNYEEFVKFYERPLSVNGLEDGDYCQWDAGIAP